MIKFLLFIVQIIGITIQLDQPEFWNLAQLDVQSIKLNLYFGWDKGSSYAYFRIKGQYKGWVALDFIIFNTKTKGFGDNQSKMDMIVLRLKQLRVEAEDRYSSNDKQIPDLNTKLKDTFLIKGDRNAVGDWDAIFKRKAVSLDPRKVSLDKSQRYITVMLGELNDEEFTKLKSKSQIFKIALTSDKLCHQSCKVGQCTGPSDQECTDCDPFRILFRNSCILRKPLLLKQIQLEDTNTLVSAKQYEIYYGFSDKNDIVYFKLKQINKWNYWMGLMFNTSSTSYTDFYVVYKTSTGQQLVSDYFINPVDNRTTEDEVIGDGDNDAFITDYSEYHITFARKTNTESKYDVVLQNPFSTSLNITIIVGSKDFFESETQPFNNQYKIPLDKTEIKCNDLCAISQCYFDDKEENCSSCKTGGLSTTGSISTCSNLLTSPNNLESVAISLPMPSAFSILIKDSKNLIQYSISNPLIVMQFEIDLQKQELTSDAIQNPKLNTNIDYNAISLKLNEFVIFLVCNSNNKVLSTVYKIDIQSIYQKISTQGVMVQQDSQCTTNQIKANILFKQSYITTSTPPIVSVDLNLHVNNYDFKSFLLYSATNINLNEVKKNSNCNSWAVTNPLICLECTNSQNRKPYCCDSNKIFSDCLSPLAPFWNDINLKSNKVKVSYGVRSDIIFFKYVIKSTQSTGSFGCGFNSNSTNTDMMIFNFQDMTVKDFYSYGDVIPQLDTVQNIEQISASQYPDKSGWEAIFARKIQVDEKINLQDKSLLNYSGSIICYLGETPQLQPSKRESYLSDTLKFSNTAICHSTCQTCQCENPTSQCEMKCTQCITGYKTDSSVPKDQCIPSSAAACSQKNCSKCTSDSCYECQSEYFLYDGKCFPNKPDLFYLNDFKISFADIGFTLLYGFDSTKEHIYFNIQGTNLGYIALGFGKHSSKMDIIMMQNSVTNNPIVTDMYSQGQIFCSQDSSSDVSYVTGGIQNGLWNITVFRSVVSKDKTQDLDIDLVNTNQVSLALGQDQYISYHKVVKVIETSFQYVQAQGGQVNYTNTYIPKKAELYNKIELPKFNTTLYYGFDKNAKFIYMKLVGKIHKNWFGIGFGNSMTSTDMIIVRYTKNPSTGNMTFVTEDKFSDGQKMPRQDISQDVVYINNSDNSELSDSKNSTVEFVRKLKTGDIYSEDFDIIYKSDTKQTVPMDLIFAVGKDQDFNTQGHTLHYLMRDVVFKSTQDCSHCENSKCSGPDDADCLDKTDVSIVANSPLGTQLTIILLFLSLLF